MAVNRPRYRLGQMIEWPTLSTACDVVDFIEYNALSAKMTSRSRRGSSKPRRLKLPRSRAVVFEVSKNGGALAAYNGRFSNETLQQNPQLPVLWLKPDLSIVPHLWQGA